MTKAGEEPVIINFNSAFEKDKWEEFDAFIFQDPNNKIQIRIEFSENKVNIFQSHASINLELNKENICPFNVGQNWINFIYLLKKIDTKDENYKSFEYDLFTEKKEFIASFKIDLSIL
ncbi:hypothetical protein [Mycoplasma procyoni]|uniref:hypothetical protein n=1 Tax=Mycoplasma procyoni TaxID=568784 RepID=UPI00197BF578|nr:hypothetical protein [Mycoplasma procyoni]MBN3534438.1 hypothetical protein [Mycoplasma procyoni]